MDGWSVEFRWGGIVVAGLRTRASNLCTLTFIGGQGPPVQAEEGAANAGDVGRVPGAQVAGLVGKGGGGG